VCVCVEAYACKLTQIIYPLITDLIL